MKGRHTPIPSGELQGLPDTTIHSDPQSPELSLPITLEAPSQRSALNALCTEVMPIGAEDGCYEYGGVLEASQFSTNFDLDKTNIVDEIKGFLLPNFFSEASLPIARGDLRITAKLRKLQVKHARHPLPSRYRFHLIEFQVYSRHVGSLRYAVKPACFASLVVCLQSSFGGKHLTFDRLYLH